jgi:hypothetical protein
MSKQSLHIAKLKVSNFGENSVISFLIDIFRRFGGPSTPFYKLNVAHANFSAETIPANHKTQTFKFRRKHCYFIPDRDIQAFKRSFHLFYTPNVAHANFSVETIPANRKMGTFKFLRKLCYFIPN